jgi:tetratricopeptide (TPR) repeat protein
MRWLRGFALGLGLLTSVNAGAWLIYLHSFAGDPGSERFFHVFGVAGPAQALEALRRQYGGSLEAIPPSELAGFLRNEPTAPYRWDSLGKSFQHAGLTDKARMCFEQAVALGPRDPGTLYDAASFRFRAGEGAAGLDLMRRALQGDPGRAESAFQEFDERQIAVDDVLRAGLPADPQVWSGYLRWLVKNDHAAEAAKVWAAMVRCGYADSRIANEYVEFLIGKKESEEAQRAWVLYAGGRAKDYPRPEGVFNGGFESDPSGVRFDWGIEARPGAAIDFDSGSPYAGARSLRIRFDGTENVTAVGISQTVFLKPGAYRFLAYVRAEGIDTDQGVAFNLIDEEDGRRLNVTSEAILGSTGWKLVEVEFRSPAGTRLVRIRMVRKGSAKFDNKVKGTLWVDQVSLRAPEMDR